MPGGKTIIIPKIMRYLQEYWRYDSSKKHQEVIWGFTSTERN